MSHAADMARQALLESARVAERHIREKEMSPRDFGKSDAMENGQDRLDRATPKDDLTFLDTEEGVEWQKEAAEHLAGGNEMHHSLDGVRIFTHDLILEMLKDGDVKEHLEAWLGAFLEDVISGGDDAALRRDICETDIKNRALEMASDMLAPYADAHAAEMMEH